MSNFGKLCNFVSHNASQSPIAGNAGGCEDIIKKTFISVSVLDRAKSGSFKIEVKADAMVDVHGYVNIIADSVRSRGYKTIGVYLHIARGLCTLLVLLRWALPEPHPVGRAMVRYPRF